VKSVWAVFLVGLVLVGVAEARLEESLEQLKARYGDPIYAEEENESYLFEKSGILLNFKLKNEKAFMVEIWQPQIPREIDSSKFTDTEIFAFLDLFKKNEDDKWEASDIRNLAKQGHKHLLGAYVLTPDDSRNAVWVVSEQGGQKLAISTAVYLDQKRKQDIEKIKNL
jgi:hypothetical protein